MATNVPIVAHGAKLYTKASATASAGAITSAIAKIGDGLAGPSISVEPIDVTNRDSTGDYYECLPGRKDAGSITLDLICDEDTITALKAYAEATALRAWKVLFKTSGASFHGAGMLTRLDLDYDKSSPINASVEIKLSGQPTFTETA